MTSNIGPSRRSPDSSTVECAPLAAHGPLLIAQTFQCSPRRSRLQPDAPLGQCSVHGSHPRARFRHNLHTSPACTDRECPAACSLPTWVGAVHLAVLRRAPQCSPASSRRHTNIASSPTSYNRGSRGSCGRCTGVYEDTPRARVSNSPHLGASTPPKPRHHR